MRDSFSDSSGDTDTNLQADLSLSVQAEDDTIKAGSDLVYTITAENTGECDLKDLRISYNFSEKGLSGEWSEGAEDAVGNTAYIEKLEVSATKIVYLTVHLPEERTTAVSLALTAVAGKVSGDNDTGEAEEIVKNAELVTQIQALQAAFEVTKTADRSMAVPGDGDPFSDLYQKYRRAHIAFNCYDGAFSAWKCTGEISGKRWCQTE